MNDEFRIVFTGHEWVIEIKPAYTDYWAWWARGLTFEEAIEYLHTASNQFVVLPIVLLR